MYTVGMCVDEEYFVPSVVTLTSLAETLPPADRGKIPLRVLTTDLSSGRASTMAAVARRLGFESFDIGWDRPKPNCRIVEGKYISAATYLRFNFTRSFVNRPYLAYLDADLLVVGDLSKPFEQLGVGRIGLVRDAVNHTIGCGPALPGVTERWPSLRGRPYFNAGVMWCPTDTLAGLRDDVDRIMLQDYRHIHFNDQDALNLWAARSDRVTSIDSAYNTFDLSRFREHSDWIYRVIDRAVPDAGAASIVHFIGPEKPWHRTCPSTEAVRLYGTYFRQAMGHISRAGDQTGVAKPNSYDSSSSPDFRRRSLFGPAGAVTTENWPAEEIPLLAIKWRPIT